MKIKSISTFSKISTIFIFALWSGTVWGQSDSTVNISTPYHSIVNHLKYLQEENFRPEWSARSLNGKSAPGENLEELAVKLKQVLDGQGIYVNPEELSTDSNYTDSLSESQRFYISRKLLPEVYLTKSGGKWQYSSYTVGKIRELHKNTYPFGADKLLDLLPDKSQSSQVFGIYIWQYIGLFLLIILTFVMHKLFSFSIEKLLILVLKKTGYERLADQYLLPVVRPVSVILIFPILITVIPVLQLPIKVGSFLILGLRVVWPIFGVIFFYRLVDLISAYLAKLASKTDSTLDDQLVPLLRKAAKTFVVAIGLLVILDNLEVNITGIIAGLSIGGLAFALAAQDTIKNFFGSLMVFFDRPFQVGDWITSGSVDGTVEEVGFRATRIRTFRNSVMYIPNGVITNQMIDNHGLRVYRRFFTTLTLTYDTTPELLQAFVEGLKEIVRNHSMTRKDYYEVHVNELGATSIEVMFYIFFQVPTWSDELKGRHEVILLIMKLAKELGVEFAFPTQTLHVNNLPSEVNNIEHIDADEAQKRIGLFMNEQFGKK